ncbi:MAG TPA: BrnT family toxin [Candidatus Saccharimonadales bacterium]|nr:BrnT family toxin [Candidatus Saccharimonadales bacterium]
MEVEWDGRKARANLAKHGVDFADAATVFHDERAITVPDGSSSEERFVTLGSDALGRIVVVAYTWRGERLRIISARRGTPRERRVYERHRK